MSRFYQNAAFDDKLWVSKSNFILENGIFTRKTNPKFEDC